MMSFGSNGACVPPSSSPLFILYFHADVPSQPWILDEERSIEILKAAWDLGINTFDTANVYSDGESEGLVARFIKKVSISDACSRIMSLPLRYQYNIPRHQIVIATKCWGVVADDPATLTMRRLGLDKLPQYVNQSGLSRAAIFNAVDACLSRYNGQWKGEG
jgi:aryl-alcohol dehydrogenase-like predicted oxidoreductase